MTEVLTRLGNYEVDESGAQVYPSIGVMNGWVAVPATFEPGVRRAWRVLAQALRGSPGASPGDVALDADGAAAVLLGGAELFKLVLFQDSRQAVPCCERDDLLAIRGDIANRDVHLHTGNACISHDISFRSAG